MQRRESEVRTEGGRLRRRRRLGEDAREGVGHYWIVEGAIVAVVGGVGQRGEALRHDVLGRHLNLPPE